MATNFGVRSAAPLTDQLLDHTVIEQSGAWVSFDDSEASGLFRTFEGDAFIEMDPEVDLIESSDDETTVTNEHAAKSVTDMEPSLKGAAAAATDAASLDESAHQGLALVESAEALIETVESLDQDCDDVVLNLSVGANQSIVRQEFSSSSSTEAATTGNEERGIALLKSAEALIETVESFDQDGDDGVMVVDRESTVKHEFQCTSSVETATSGNEEHAIANGQDEIAVNRTTDCDEINSRNNDDELCDSKTHSTSARQRFKARMVMAKKRERRARMQRFEEERRASLKKIAEEEASGSEVDVQVEDQLANAKVDEESNPIPSPKSSPDALSSSHLMFLGRYLEGIDPSPGISPTGVDKKADPDEPSEKALASTRAANKSETDRNVDMAATVCGDIAPFNSDKVIEQPKDAPLDEGDELGTEGYHGVDEEECLGSKSKDSTDANTQTEIDTMIDAVINDDTVQDLEGMDQSPQSKDRDASDKEETRKMSIAQVLKSTKKSLDEKDVDDGDESLAETCQSSVYDTESSVEDISYAEETYTQDMIDSAEVNEEIEVVHQSDEESCGGSDIDPTKDDESTCMSQDESTYASTAMYLSDDEEEDDDEDERNVKNAFGATPCDLNAFAGCTGFCDIARPLISALV